MTVMLLALALLSGLELLIFLPVIWRFRQLPAVMIALALAVTSGGIFERQAIIPGLLILSVSMYRLFNLLRIAASHIDSRRLHSMTWRSSWNLLLLQTLVISLVLTAKQTPLTNNAWWLLVTLVQIAGTALLFITTKRQLRKTNPLPITTAYANHELPSLTVCVPARNETDTLAECLRTILASDYPKLEIIVLDDCSQDKTSSVIKSFAHEGVRFLHGTEPPDTWLAKNWAYQQLYEAANGDFLVFCGVDIRFEPGSLRAMMSMALSRQKTMLCVLPRNVSPPDIRPSHSTLLQPMRYAWELALPRRRFNRPPALSSCWLIQRALLQKRGSFAAVSRSIDPERAIAQAAIRHDDYSFLRSTDELAVTSAKSLRDQLETAIRMRYPQLRRRPELVWLVSIVELVFFVAPLPLLIWALLDHNWLLAGLSSLAVVISNYTYGQIVRLTYQKFLWRSLLTLPFAALADISIRHFSMWQYEFSEVYWKGRNVCLPIMEVIPRLPKLK